jgi:hypothetical protein
MPRTGAIGGAVRRVLTGEAERDARRAADDLERGAGELPRTER